MTQVVSRTYKCYTDESGTKNPDRYMVIGGFIMRAADKLEVERAIEEHCLQRGLIGEIKWKKTNKRNIDRHIEIVDRLHLLTISTIGYKSVVIDKWNIDHKKFNLGSSIVGYHKFLYYLVVRKFGRTIGPSDKLYVRVDTQTGDYDYVDFVRILNNGFRKDYEHISNDVVIEVSQRDSGKCRLTQVSDLITGGLRFAINRSIYEKRGDTEKEKFQLSDYICTKWGVSKYLKAPASTPWEKRDFEIWHFALKS